MADWNLPMSGGCRCGAVRFRIDAAPLFTAICHCHGCQRMSASAYSTSICVPAGGFAVTQGEAVIGGMHDAQVRHHHCDGCKSWLYTDFEPPMGFVNVRATMLDDARWFTPFIESFTSTALPWARPRGIPHSFAEFPPMERYPELLAEFAAR